MLYKNTILFAQTRQTWKSFVNLLSFTQTKSHYLAEHLNPAQTRVRVEISRLYLTTNPHQRWVDFEENITVNVSTNSYKLTVEKNAYVNSRMLNRIQGFYSLRVPPFYSILDSLKIFLFYTGPICSNVRDTAIMYGELWEQLGTRTAHPNAWIVPLDSAFH